MNAWYRFIASVTAFCMAISVVYVSLGEEPLAQPVAEEHEYAFVVEEQSGGQGDAPQYWLGLMGEPVNEALKSQLKIEGGLVVVEVVKDSPAANAGLQPHDILLRFGDKPVIELGSLMEVLRAANGAETDLDILRGGEKTTLKISPAKRPAEQQGLLHEELDVLRSHPLGDMIVRRGPERMRLYAVRPGLVLGGAHEFPKNTSITIQKTDEGPAKIDVKQGDKSWSVTEDKLNELPEDVRGIVQNMLSGGPRAVRARAVPPGAPIPPVRLRVEEWQQRGAVPVPHRVHIEATPAGDDWSKKIDALIEKIEHLEKEIQSLKEKSAQ